MFEDFRGVWSPVLPSKALRSGTPLALKLAGTPLVLFRDGEGRPAALVDRCPHRGVALSLGRVEAGCIECPFHGWRFDAAGSVRHVPWNPEANGERLRAVSVPTAELAGQIWVHSAVMTDSAPPPPPSVAEVFLRRDVRLSSFAVEWKTHWSRAMENMLDWPHLPFVHGRTIGRGMRQTATSRMDVIWEPTPWGATSHVAVDGVHRPGTLELRWPNVMVLTVPIPSRTLVLSAACVPVDGGTARLVITSARDFLKLGLFDYFFDRMNRRIGDEDRAIVESSSPREVPRAAEERSVRTDALPLHFRKRYYAELRGNGTASVATGPRRLPMAPAPAHP